MNEYTKNILEQASKSKQQSGTDSTGGLAGIHRPNYQRQKQRNQSSQVVPEPKWSKTLETGHQDKSAHSEPFVPQLGKRPPVQKGVGAELIGRAKNGQSVWHFIPSADVRSPINRYLGGSDKPIGLITDIPEGPGTLFLLDEWMGKDPGLQCEVYRDGEHDQLPRAIKIFAENDSFLIPLLKEVYQRIHRRSLRTVEAYAREKPSLFLYDSLQMNQGESVSILEGVPFFYGIALLERYLCQNSDTSFEYEIRENFILLKGGWVEINRATQLLKQEAEKLLQ